MHAKWLFACDRFEAPERETPKLLPLARFTRENEIKSEMLTFYNRADEKDDEDNENGSERGEGPSSCPSEFSLDLEIIMGPFLTELLFCPVKLPFPAR